jgi:hypothetical protein
MTDETTVRVMPDYDCHPLWVHHGENVGDTENVDPHDLSVSAALAEALDRWADDYDATLDRDDPVDSGFATPAAEEDFAVRGERLARCLKEELGAAARVVYFDIRTSVNVLMG